MGKNSIELTTLTDSNSDSFLIKFFGKSKNSYVLIDGGLKPNGKKTLELLNDIFIKNETIDLIILTHVDLDHINGLLTLFASESVNAETIKGVVFNVPHDEEEMTVLKEKSTQCGYSEGNKLLELILKKGIKILSAVQGEVIAIDNDIIIEIISPTQSALDIDHKNWRDTNIGHDESEDYQKDNLLKEKHAEDSKPQNVSSIACLIHYDGKKMLFSGDSVPSQMLSAVENVTAVDFFKIPHHGSKYNISEALLERFPSEVYLIPGSRGAYPNFYTIALIENYRASSKIYVPKNSWVHSDRYKKIIDLSFIEYEIGTKVLL